MRGFAIPRRWLISLALVGLVSLFAATLTSSWTDPSRAAAQTGTLPSNLLASVFISPNNINVNLGTTVDLEARPRNSSNVVNTAMPNVTYTWSIVSGTGSFSATNTRTTTFTVPSTASSVTVKVVANQEGNSKEATALIHAVAPAPTATPAPPPTNPGPTPSAIPNASTVITPAEGGTATDPSDPTNSISVPPGATTSYKGVKIETQSSGIPPAPGDFRIGSKVVNITFYDESGTALTGVRLDRAARICISVTPQDVEDAHGGPDGLTILRYVDPPGEWVSLTATYNPLTGQVCASSSNFSLFAVGLENAPPSTGEAGLPATGDTPLSAGMLVFLSVIGVSLVGVGAVAFRRSRGVGSVS